MINFQPIHNFVSNIEGGQNAMIYINRYIAQAIKEDKISPVELNDKLSACLTHVVSSEDDKQKIRNKVQEFLISEGIKIEMDINEMIHAKMLEIRSANDAETREALKKERDELLAERRRQCGRA